MPANRRSHRRLLVLAIVPLAVALLGNACPFGSPEVLGPYAVGRTTITLVDPTRDDRTLPVDVWYPAVDDGTTPFSVYDLLVAGIESDVALDSPPALPDEFPLLVFSHGNAGIRYQSIFLQEHLASHGFVVAAPDHVGNTAADLILPNPPPFEAKDRPLDVSFVIDQMLERDGDPASPFYMLIDEHRIGVLGHSFGGWTTLTMAAGFDDVPPDDRVSAILPISPASGGLSDDQLADVDLPTLVLGGTADTITPVDPNSIRAFEQTSGRPRWRVDVHDAGHNSFTEICLFFEALVGAGLPPEILAFLLGNVEQGCGADLIPIEEAQRITKLYATSFFQTQLAHRVGFIAYLTRGYVRKTDLPVDFFKAPPFPGHGVPGRGHPDPE